MQRFTPRKPTSNWSAVNIAKIEQLRAEGRMRPGRRGGVRAPARRSAPASTRYEQRHQAALEPEQQARFEADADAWAYWSGGADRLPHDGDLVGGRARRSPRRASAGWAR